jgi:hypothetical protein
VSRLLAAVTLAFVTFSPASAQPAPQNVRFTVFSARPIEGVTFTPSARAAPQKLVFYPTARSPRYEYRGGMPLRFTDAAGAVVAEATIPPEIHDALLLFTAVEPASAVASAKEGAPPSGLRYQISVLDDGAARHGPGGLAIINFSGLTLGGMVDDQNVTLKPGLNPALTVGRSAKIFLRTIFKARSYQSYADTLELKKNERALLILFPPFYKGSLEVQSRLLVDEPPTASAPAKTR